MYVFYQFKNLCQIYSLLEVMLDFGSAEVFDDALVFKTSVFQSVGEDVKLDGFKGSFLDEVMGNVSNVAILEGFGHGDF
jgi:hypothetical protein